MKSKLILIVSSLTLLLACISVNEVIAQDKKEDKEVIIIEKVVDADGNVIETKTKRYQGQYTEDEIQEFIGEEGQPFTRSYDLDGLGFGGDIERMFGQQSSRPTIGINIDFSDDKATIAKVTRGSGAEESDIREGDEIISIEGVAISTIEDIHILLDTKKVGDAIRLKIFRDGQEIDKEVSLGGSNRGFFFELPEGETFDFVT